MVSLKWRCFITLVVKCLKGNHTLFSLPKTVVCTVGITVLCENFADSDLCLILHSSVTDEYFQIDLAPVEKHLSNKLQSQIQVMWKRV